MSEAPGTRDCVRQRTSSSDETVPVKRPRTEETEESSKLEDDETTIKLIQELEARQLGLDRLHEEEAEAVVEIHNAFAKRRAPIYKERTKITSKIPLFWPTVLMNSPTLAELLSEADTSVIQFLENLTVEENINENFKGECFRITLDFLENPFVKDRTFSKEYYFGDDGNVSFVGKPKEPALIEDQEVDVKDSILFWLNSDVESALHIKEEIWVDPLRFFNDEANMEMLDEEDGEGADAESAIILSDDEDESSASDYKQEEGNAAESS